MSTPEAVLLDEVRRAALRVVQERIRLAEPTQFCDVNVVLIPAGIYDRLERAMRLLSDYDGSNTLER